MLVELGVVEQRTKAVYEVLDGADVTDVAKRYGVARQTVHKWVKRYANDGFSALVDKSSKPEHCPHQMAAVIEARVLEMRRAHPDWGPRTILYWLGRDGVDPLPGRSSVYRALVRHRLVEPKKRRRKKSDYKSWERSKPMELWQMDVVGGFHLKDATELKCLTGIDDHSRYCVSARLMARATARPVCEALKRALRTHGVPGEILSDIQDESVLVSARCPAGGVRLRGDRRLPVVVTDRSERAHDFSPVDHEAGRSIAGTKTPC